MAIPSVAAAALVMSFHLTDGQLNQPLVLGLTLPNVITHTQHMGSTEAKFNPRQRLFFFNFR